MKKNINIAITDDESLVTNLLHDFISATPGFKVLFTALSGEQLLDWMHTTKTPPDIVLLDLKMKGMDGVEVAQALKASFPNVRVVVVSSYFQESSTAFMLKTGASAFLPKEISPAGLLHVLRSVAEKGFYFTAGQMEAIAGQVSGKAPAPVLEAADSLSARELDVLRLLCHQKTAREIGEKLFIAHRTVEGHKNNLFAKTGVKNLAGLVIYAIQRGIVRVEDLPVV